MANIKSAKKQARQAEVRRVTNMARKTAIKTAIKKAQAAIEAGNDLAAVQQLLRDAESKIARAKGKGVLKANTAARRISGLAKQAAAAKKR
jgi:small subunit ribosomal protein S20